MSHPFIQYPVTLQLLYPKSPCPNFDKHLGKLEPFGKNEKKSPGTNLSKNVLPGSNLLGNNMSRKITRGITRPSTGSSAKSSGLTFLLMGTLGLLATSTFAAEWPTSQGFKSGVGARALSMGEAFTGLADDASALYYNPAGLTQLRSNVFHLSVGHEYLESL
jgi:hypothetical protein